MSKAAEAPHHHHASTATSAWACSSAAVHAVGRRRSGSSGTISRIGCDAVRYLSLDWIDAVADEAGRSDAVAAAAANGEIGVTQVVTDAPDGTIVYSLEVIDGRLSFHAGGAFPEHV